MLESQHREEVPGSHTKSHRDRKIRRNLLVNRRIKTPEISLVQNPRWIRFRAGSADWTTSRRKLLANVATDKRETKLPKPANPNTRMSTAFSIHSFCGNSRFVSHPIFFACPKFFGWRLAKLDQQPGRPLGGRLMFKHIHNGHFFCGVATAETCT